MPKSISEEEIVFPLPRILTFVAFTEIPLSAVSTEILSVMFSVESS